VFAATFAHSDYRRFVLATFPNTFAFNLHKVYSAKASGSG
jgi:hypothetical protein